MGTRHAPVPGRGVEPQIRDLNGSNWSGDDDRDVYVKNNVFAICIEARGHCGVGRKSIGVCRCDNGEWFIIRVN